LFVEGREIIVKSRTGTGKTLSFLLPLEELIMREQEENRETKMTALILEPTRELANQVNGEIAKMTSLRSELLTGGYSDRVEQMRRLKRDPPEILVATPGRLLDLIQNFGLDLEQSVNYLILDEGDMMLDLGFERDLERLMRQHLH
jgi:superfamily II DNA/RNA helicase